MLTIFVVLFVGGSSVKSQTLKGGWIHAEFDAYNVTDKLTYYYFTFHRYGKSASGMLLRFWDAVTGELVFQRYEPGGADTTDYFSNPFSPCQGSASLNNPYTIYYRHMSWGVKANPNGFIITASFDGRDPEIQNIFQPEYTGLLLRTSIPGTINNIDYHKNSSPYIFFKDTITACINSYFTYQVLAADKNGDSLSYSLGDAIKIPIDSTGPVEDPVVYNPTYSGTDPLGTGATINPVTGLLSGIAPAIPGGYNIAVYVKEWRNGVLINTTRVESQLKAVACPFAGPLLKPLYQSCRDFTYKFKNEVTCPGITSYRWDFGDTTSTADTSSLPSPTYTYPAVGTYKLKLWVSNNDGFVDSAESVVSILGSVAISLPPDTAMCKTDSIILKPVSEATSYTWRESGGGSTLNNYNTRFPKASPVFDTTTYYVTGALNSCRDSARITVYASPYPKVKLGADTAICIGNSVMLNGTASGAYYNWSPTTHLLNATTLQPTSNTRKTITYTLSVRDTFSCPKTVKDSIVVKVVPAFTVNGGPDANVVPGQPYQLKATTSGTAEPIKYLWQPSRFLNNNTLADPVATLTTAAQFSVPFTVVATTVDGKCTVTDEVIIKMFTTGADILVPTAFSPNGDGKNDVLKPVLIGMKKLERFAVYNRWGQVVFSTTENNKGWDGNINGSPQNGNVYVFTVEGINYLGKKIFKKGTVVLIK